ncbi:MAG: iron-containing alcohol dehydrogenase [Anaerolineaceae bacterium]|nr:iron-containing alcohol dehydrogenase [Anaerolineaceae bacterium]
MWYFSSPQIVFGEGSLSHLEKLSGQRAIIVSDENLVGLGYVERVSQLLTPRMQVQVFATVEPDPSLETTWRGAKAMLAFAPDWIIALGGGSVMDAAKAMWVLYERPDLTPESINPIDQIGLRQKARLVAIPTTSGTGSEATWAIVLTDPVARRKLGLGSRENLPDIAILDPELVAQLSPRLTADTGLDALVHAIEGYTSSWSNDFSDGLCLKAMQLIFEWLPRAYRDGSDLEARTHMQNAAAIAGLGFGNSMAALAHGMGHALGAVFHVPHGRAVALFLPYTIEYCAHPASSSTRYGEMARFLGLEGTEGGAVELAVAIRVLSRQVGQPLTIADCGITLEDFERELDLLVLNALMDTQTIMSIRVPESDDLRELFRAAYEGWRVEF